MFPCILVEYKNVIGFIDRTIYSFRYNERKQKTVNNTLDKIKESETKKRRKRNRTRYYRKQQQNSSCQSLGMEIIIFYTKHCTITIAGSNRKLPCDDNDRPYSYG